MDSKEPIKLSELEVEINIKNLDEAIEKLEKIKSLICEINDLSNGKLFEEHVIVNNNLVTPVQTARAIRGISLDNQGQERKGRMEGYFNQGRIGENGNLKICVTNVPEFRQLLSKAKEEADQLHRTIGQLENFDLNVEVSVKKE